MELLDITHDLEDNEYHSLLQHVCGTKLPDILDDNQCDECRKINHPDIINIPLKRVHDFISNFDEDDDNDDDDQPLRKRKSIESNLPEEEITTKKLKADHDSIPDSDSDSDSEPEPEPDSDTEPE
jgi:hypothetical protein